MKTIGNICAWLVIIAFLALAATAAAAVVYTSVQTFGVYTTLAVLFVGAVCVAGCYHMHMYW